MHEQYSLQCKLRTHGAVRHSFRDDVIPSRNTLSSDVCRQITGSTGSVERCTVCRSVSLACVTYSQTPYFSLTAFIRMDQNVWTSAEKNVNTRGIRYFWAGVRRKRRK